MSELWKYIETQINVVPQKIYEGLLILFCLVTPLLVIVGRKKASYIIAGLFLLEYVFFVLGMTVLYRHWGLVKIYPSPFWSCVSIVRDGNMTILF